MPRDYTPNYGQHFDARRTKDARGDVVVLHEGVVSLSIPAGSTDFDSLMKFSSSSSKPFPIKYLSRN